MARATQAARPARLGRPAAIVIALALCAGVAHGDGPRTTAIGFDHTLHTRDVEVSGASEIACARCHDVKAGRLVGRPGHAACFGACHGASPATPRRGTTLALEPDRVKLCTNCHAEAVLVAPFSGRLAVPYPPYTIDRDFNLTLGHAQHRAVACTLCHDPVARERPAARGRPAAHEPAPHARCSGCHDGTPTAGHAFAMAACATCHPRAVGKPQPPELAAVQNTVTAVFSHASHAARGAAGRDCVTCHAKIREAAGTELPRPTAKDCASCHDGKQAFAVTAACSRCHDAPKDPYDVDRPDARFHHDGAHAPVIASEPCSTCHLLDAKTGEVSIAGHAACTACHADDFGERHPKKCGACHNATEPWRRLRADRPPPETTEFGASLEHAKHPGSCVHCHTLTTPATQLRPPRGHGLCEGAGCHATTGGAAPQLSRCAACHQLGLVAARAAKSLANPWSVRLAFDHRQHAQDHDGAPVACITCHTSLVGPIVDLATPAKATCAPCHDGARAFKLTGTTCRRCHTGGVPGGRR